MDQSSNIEKKKAGGLEDWLSRNTVSVLVWVAIGALLFALIVASLYVFVFRAPPVSADAATMGQVGDFFGGLLNPIFSFLSMLALLVALVIQGKELKLSRKELKLSRKEMRKSGEALEAQNSAIEHQRFEQTFFAWLGTYRGMLEGLEETIRHYRGAEITRTQLHGTRALLYWLNEAKTSVESRLTSIIPDAERQEATEAVGTSSGATLIYLAQQGWGGQISKLSLDRWQETYDDNESQLGGLFRVLYRLLLWIDSHDAQKLTDAQKWLYVSIIRAQLSEAELVHLFFNSLTAKGAKLKRLIDKYALFDNLSVGSNPTCEVMKMAPPNGQGYAPSAYDSALARKALGLPESAEETLAMAAKGPHQVTS